MKSRVCPYKNHCHDAGNCEDCDHGKAYEGLANKVKRLKAKNKELIEENEILKSRIDVILHPNF